MKIECIFFIDMADDIIEEIGIEEWYRLLMLVYRYNSPSLSMMRTMAMMSQAQKERCLVLAVILSNGNMVRWFSEEIDVAEVLTRQPYSIYNNTSIGHFKYLLKEGFISKGQLYSLVTKWTELSVNKSMCDQIMEIM